MGLTIKEIDRKGGYLKFTMRPFDFFGIEKLEVYRKIFDEEGLISSVEDYFIITIKKFLKYAPEEFDQLIKEIKESIAKEESSEKKEDSAG